jgi:hypothetical protein
MSESLIVNIDNSEEWIVNRSQADDNHNGHQSACAPHSSLFTIHSYLISRPCGKIVGAFGQPQDFPL